MFFTSEWLTEGYSGKFWDQISDVVLDERPKMDPLSGVACETYVTMGVLIVAADHDERAV